MSYLISIILSAVVGVMAGYWLRGSHEFATRSLRKQLQISKCPNPIYDSTTYYTIYIAVGRGDKYCRFLKFLQIPVRLVVSGVIRWIPVDDPNSGGFHSFAFPVSPGRLVLEQNPDFYLIPNTKLELAVAKSQPADFNIYALGGFRQVIPFNESYNLHLYLFDQDRNQLCPPLILENYILDKRVNL